MPDSPEHRLYELLAVNESDSAHSRYNALIRRLVSFERDFYSQALAKLERGHRMDMRDVNEMVRHRLIELPRLSAMFDEIEGELYRYPALDAASFRQTVKQFCSS